MGYDNQSVYSNFNSEESDCGCNSDCGCCPTGTVEVYGSNGEKAGCLTPNDAELYTIGTYMPSEGYVKLIHPVTGVYLGDVLQSDLVGLLASLNKGVTLSVTNVLCNGESTGTASVNAVGYEAPISITWTDDLDVAADPGALAAGAYKVTITDNTGETVIKTFVVTEPDALGLTVNVNGGTASAVVTGGTMPYTYEWKDNLGTPTGDTTQTVTGYAPGTYQVEVTDANGCTIEDTNVVIV